MLYAMLTICDPTSSDRRLSRAGSRLILVPAVPARSRRRGLADARVRGDHFTQRRRLVAKSPADPSQTSGRVRGGEHLDAYPIGIRPTAR